MDWEKFQKKIQPCSECKKERDCEPEQGKCYWCWITWFGLNFFQWVVCPKCSKEVSKLKENGLCWDCDDELFKKLEKDKRNLARLIKIFGSVKTANYFTFANFKVREDNREAYDKCKNFVSDRDNLYLHGSTGNGKTHLAYAAAKVHFLNDKKVVITTPMRMIDTFRTKSFEEKEDRMEEFTECDLLLIDDFGVSKHTDFAIEILCELLNRRTLQMRNGLIVTSNLSLDQLARKNTDDRITSRLAGLCAVIEVSGEDWRLSKRRADIDG